MKVLFVTSEAFPLLKTGGLGDVSGALPAALAEAGEDVHMLLPGYPQALENADHVGVTIALGNILGFEDVSLIEARMPDNGVPLWLINCPQLYDRPGNPYVQDGKTDWPDNHLRFALLSYVAAILSVPDNACGWTADIVHTNDWQGGLTAAYLHFWGIRQRARTVFTVHNLQYLGLFTPDVLPQVGLPDAAFSIDGLEFHHKVSFLKAGLYYSDAITTVSPTYAKEIMLPEFGCGLDGLLRQRADSVHGILNGIDDDIWNPKTDPHIPHHFSLARRTGKIQNKAALQHEMGLPADLDAPLFCVVSRLTEQKGIELIAKSASALRKLGIQLAILGSGDHHLEELLSVISGLDLGIKVKIGYDDALAHRIIAGSDVLLMPSQFEPCGLTQMYAMRYGTLPLVYKTGGLADTVVDCGTAGDGTGFVFETASTDALTATAKRATDLYRHPKLWQKAQRNAMSQDMSWKHAAPAYMRLYKNLAAT
ncbi:glycogen synthase GlgA [Magnetovibrio blakemorei]|uniref:Glycogen synthase n=1 Tax=Magnetovibrio blakemorei TaxID=28181 RepID=A0A1E5Q650_9PROT|nr:glycogen synthase GlgA [Magnetovibrio blakemorei]OEJ66220.1 starch synthase [Magnetovibrio blakemorei]